MATSVFGLWGNWQVGSQIVIKIKGWRTVKVVIEIFYLENNLISYLVMCYLVDDEECHCYD